MDLTSGDVFVKFHGTKFVLNSEVLIMVGEVYYEKSVKRFAELFPTGEKGEDFPTDFPAPPVRSKRQAYLIDRPGSAQSNIVIANSGITRTSPDYFAMLLMHTVLGANASSRLFMNLREDKGYTYGAYTNLDSRRTAGGFCRPARECTTLFG